MRVIRRTPPDYRTMPWKNGGGITHEMFIYPEDATLQKGDFLWRLSSANVGESGPFSTFPGYDRVLFLLSGNGLELTVNGETVPLRSPFDSLRFRGEHDASCMLTDGPVTDFNIFCRREILTCEYRHLFSKKDIERLFLPGDTTILLCLQGEATAEIEGKHPLKEMEMLVVTDHSWGQPLTLQYGEKARLLFITLTKR